MQIAGDDHLRASLDAALKANGVPDGADIVFMPEPPIAMRAVALHADGAWVGLLTEGSAPFVKKADTEHEAAAMARAAEIARKQQVTAKEPMPAPSYQDPKQTATAHPGAVDESTPDDPRTGHGWRLLQSETAAPVAKKPTAQETLKALTERLQRMVPHVEPVHPLQKSFLLAEGFDAASVERGEIEMTPHLRREYSRWLAKHARDMATQLLARTR